MERAGADLSNTYNHFSVTQLGAKILEFKFDPVPKILDKGLEFKRSAPSLSKTRPNFVILTILM